MLAYLGSGIVAIGPDQVGALRRSGRYVPPLLEPGLHLRLPPPWEVVTLVEPDRARVARVGLSTPSGTGPVAWNATHGTKRADEALFLTGDEDLVAIPLSRYFPKRTYGLVIRKGKFLSPAAQQFVNLMREANKGKRPPAVSPGSNQLFGFYGPIDGRADGGPHGRSGRR